LTCQLIHWLFLVRHKEPLVLGCGLLRKKWSRNARVLPIETSDSTDNETTLKDTAKAKLPDGLPMRQRERAAATVLLAIAITVLDATMSNVALPTIAMELDIEPAQVVWISIAYSLTVVMTVLPLSALAHRVGLRRLFIIGTVVYLSASLGAAYAQNFVLL